MIRLRFLSRNKHKFVEFEAMLAPSGFQAIRVDTEIDEIQSACVEKIVQDKLAHLIHSFFWRTTETI